MFPILLLLINLSFLSATTDTIEQKQYFQVQNNFSEIVMETTLSPAFYIPAGLALISFYDDIGKRITRDARENHNVWGDQETAKDASDQLRTLTTVSMLTSSFLYKDEGWQYVTKNLFFDIFAAFSAIQVRGFVSDGGRRTRPNGKEKSFPSGHATAAGSRASLSNYNIFQSDLEPTTKYTLATLNWSLAYFTSYSRIEGHAHYAEDVLAGIAIGYWVTNVLKRSLTSTYWKDHEISFDMYRESFLIGYKYSF